MIKGVICDLDGFLVQTWGTEPLPGVLETLAVLRERGILVAVATNQAGPLWRVATGQTKYPTAQEVASRLLVAASRLGLTDAVWYIATHDDRVLTLLSASDVQETVDSLSGSLTSALGTLPNYVSAAPGWRKPEHDMLLATCAAWGIEPAEAVYGGDMDSDRQAAKAAGMRFVERLQDVLPLLEPDA